MRIQHNILAMNAYRNYNNNTTALGKNLEKLSSGYKINRAGDDAAGLAISEKMRAQITGLSAASKNVKDGISLVKTAEGAMQEIQDMLNRMDSLATQSANGTYDNETDRAALQQEVDALRDEINRIADSANFNGIKLLDGSLDTTKVAIPGSSEEVVTTIDPTADNQMKVGEALPGVGMVLGTDTVLHQQTQANSTGTEFSVALHDFAFQNKEGNEMTIQVGDTKITLKALQDGASGSETLTGEALVNAIVNGTTANYEVTVDGVRYSKNDSISINGQNFTMSAGLVEDGTVHSLKFTQDAPPADATEEVNGAMDVTISGDIAPTKANFTLKFDGSLNKLGTKITIDYGDGNKDTITIATTAKTALADALKDLKYFEGTVLGTAASKAGETVEVSLTAKEAGKKEKPTITIETEAMTVATGAKEVTGVSGIRGEATLTVAVGSDAVTSSTKFTVAGLSGLVSEDGTQMDGITYGESSSGKAKMVSGKNTVDVEWKYDAGTNKITVKTLTETAAVNSVVLAATAGSSSASGGAAVSFGGATAGVATTWQSTTYSAVTAANLSADYTLTISDKSGKVLKEISQQELAKLTANSGTADFSIGTGSSKQDYKIEFTPSKGFKITQTDGPVNANNVSDMIDISYKASVDNPTVKVESYGSDLKKNSMTGDYNVQTVDVNTVTADSKNRLASTWFKLNMDMLAEGSRLQIGDKTYVFTANKDKLKEGAADVDNTTEVYVDINSGDLDTIGAKLTDAAQKYGNSIWTVGYANGRVTLTETLKHRDNSYDTNTGEYKNYEGDYDLSTIEGIEASLGFYGVAYEKSETVTTEAVEGGKALNLQIGDTSDAWNQMKISVGDMHTDAMGDDEGNSIADISVATAEDAQVAVDIIKSAINYVSSVRGQLGAYQNRLEHTQNNLSVMTENIQDAESTIRDTDVADEMMSYVKNNILIQSAQAMLAQANQVPQGVLQLLG